jgi:hypothetical protein
MRKRIRQVSYLWDSAARMVRAIKNNDTIYMPSLFKRIHAKSKMHTVRSPGAKNDKGGSTGI